MKHAPTNVRNQCRQVQHIVGKMLFTMLLLASFGTANAQTWFSLQEGDVRTGSDLTNVNTGGTLLTTNYDTRISDIRADSPNGNFNAATNYLYGTYGTVIRRLLLGWDLAPVADFVGGRAFVITGARVLLTQADSGENDGNASMMICQTPPFTNETVATWNNPGPGQTAGGTIAATIINPTYASINHGGPRVLTYTNAGIGGVVGAALANSEDKTAYFLLKRNNEAAGNYNLSIVTDEDTNSYHSAIKGDDYGGINSRPELQVCVTVLSNAPLVSISALTSEISENGTNLGIFMISRTVNLTNALTVTFEIHNTPTLGDAELGVDFTTSATSTVTLSANVASTNIYITPINDPLIEDDENIIVTVYDSTGTNYGIVQPTATMVLHDDNDAGALVDYMFGYNLSPHVWDINVTATNLVLPRFPMSLGTSGYSVSYPSAAYTFGAITPSTEADAMALLSYVGTTLTPAFGHLLTLTGVQFDSKYWTAGSSGDPNALESVWFLRSSLDNYATTLVAVTNPISYDPGDFTTTSLSLGVEFSNLCNVTFRLYLYDDSTNDSSETFIDNLFYFGQTQPLSAAQQQIVITASSPNASEPSTPGALTLTRTTNDMTSALDVGYTLSGAASNGVDYTYLTGVATIPAGTNSTVVVVSPLSDALVEGSESVIMTLQSTSNLFVWGAGVATVTIADHVVPTTPVITQIAVVGTSVAIQFSAGAADMASSFALQSSTTVDGTYADETAAIITGSAGTFQATIAVNGPARFYRVRH